MPGEPFFSVAYENSAPQNFPSFHQGQQSGQRRSDLVGSFCPPFRSLAICSMKPFASRRHGTTRTVFLFGPFAFKIGRTAEGRRCNMRKRRRWLAATPARREMLCPTLFAFFAGAVAVQQRATPMSEDDAEHRRSLGWFPSWEYMPGETHGDPTESKAADWGYLRGHSDPVALDNGLPDDCC